MAITRSMSRCRTKGSGVYLSEELIFKILSWTCVTTLLRCKSVCKLWLSIISKPEFIQAHHTNSLEKSPSSVLIITSKVSEIEPASDLNLDHIKTINYYAATIIYPNSNSVNLPLLSPFDHMDFVASCNGIVCVSSGGADYIYLLNPLTSMSKKLPPVPQRKYYPSFTAIDVVFGFDSVSLDYKVLRIDSWREIEVLDVLPRLVSYPCCPVLRSGPVLDGVLHMEGMNEIVMFDLHTELFQAIPFPSFIQTRKSNIFNFEGSISVLVESGSLDDKEISLWTMKSVSGQHLSNLIFTFDHGFKIDWVFFYLGAKQFVGTTELGTVFYDYGMKVTTYIGLPSQSFLATILRHTESLLSPEGFERVEEIS
ncbi:hypothetical protein OROHE_009087 [Orobanche hederae]